MALRPFIIDMTDDRCQYVFDSLKEKGFPVIDKANVTEYEPCTLIVSPSKAINVSTVQELKEGSVVFGGHIDYKTNAFLASRNITYFNMLADERYTVRNTIPTALGCIYRFMEHNQICINQARTLVLGYGRVAKTLVKYLIGLDVSTYVYTVDEKEMALAEILSDGIEESLNNINQYGFIINTIPKKIIDEAIMDNISADAFVCDLSSGDNVDLVGLNKRGIKAIKAQGLPGYIAPRSAGIYMEKCILDTLHKHEDLDTLFSKG